MSLCPTAKHNGQESRGVLCEIFKFRSFLQSKSVNNGLQTASASASASTGASSLDPTCRLPSPDQLGIARPPIPLVLFGLQLHGVVAVRTALRWKHQNAVATSSTKPD